MEADSRVRGFMGFQTPRPCYLLDNMSLKENDRYYEDIQECLENALADTLIKSRQHPGLSIERIAKCFTDNWHWTDRHALLKEMAKQETEQIIDRFKDFSIAFEEIEKKTR